MSTQIFTFNDSGKLISNNIAFGWVDPGGLNFSMHDHDYFEVSLMISGRVRHVLDEGAYTIKKGDAIFVRPWDRHTFEMINGEDFLFLNIPFTHQALQRLRDYMEEHYAIDALLQAAEPPLGSVGSMVIYQAESLRQVNNLQYMRRALYTLLENIVASAFLSQHEDPVDHGPEWFQKVCMEMMIPQNLRAGLPRMIELSGHSQEHLSRTFKKVMNVTPTGYINTLRIERACKILRHSHANVLDIAYAVGFENLSYFYRVFRQITGMTPLDYRNNARNADAH